MSDDETWIALGAALRNTRVWMELRAIEQAKPSNERKAGDSFKEPPEFAGAGGDASEKCAQSSCPRVLRERGGAVPVVAGDRTVAKETATTPQGTGVGNDAVAVAPWGAFVSDDNINSHPYPDVRCSGWRFRLLSLIARTPAGSFAKVRVARLYRSPAMLGSLQGTCSGGSYRSGASSRLPSDFDQ